MGEHMRFIILSAEQIHDSLTKQINEDEQGLLFFPPLF